MYRSESIQPRYNSEDDCRILTDPAAVSNPEDDVPLLQAVDPEDVIIHSGLSPEKIRLIRTVSMIGFYMCMGLVSGVISPAILDLMELFHCDLVDFNLMMISKTIGIFIGSFLGGIVANRYRHRTDLVLAFAGIIIGLSNVAIPWCPSLYIAIIPVGLVGISHGTINVICCTVTMAEWGERSASLINMLHFGFSLGAFLAPPTVAPFLSHLVQNTTEEYDIEDYLLNMSPKDNIWNKTNHWNDVDRSYGNTTDGNETRIVIPFAFHGTVGVCVGIVFLGYYFAGWKYESADQSSKSTSESAHVDQNVERRGRDKFRIYMAISIFIIYIGIIMRDYSINSFIFYVCVEGPLHMSKARGAIVNTANNASWVVGRFLGMITAKYIKIHYIVFTGIIGTVILDIVLVFYGLRIEMLLWVVVCAVGVLAGPTYPSVMAWANRYLIMDGVMVALIDTGIAAGLIMAQYLGGYLIEYHGTVYSFILAASGAAFLLTVMVITQIICSMKGDRFKGQTVDDVNVDTEPLID